MIIQSPIPKAIPPPNDPPSNPFCGAGVGLPGGSVVTIGTIVAGVVGSSVIMVTGMADPAKQ
jgi:hypothetical protein